MSEIPAGLLLLQQEVPDKLVGKLPRVTCRKCKDNRCDEHKPSKCQECGGWLGKHTHLEYVGHAETTSKLLEADFAWSWEPLAFGDDGLPRFDADGGLWIKLTVCGVSRLGYGTAEASSFKAKGDIRKEIIGDAIRNAAMRFGWALNLWAKTDIHERTPQEHEAAQAGHASPDRKNGPSKGQLGALNTLISRKRGNLPRPRRLAVVVEMVGRDLTSSADLTPAEAHQLIKRLEAESDHVPEQPTAPEAPEVPPVSEAEQPQADPAPSAASSDPDGLCADMEAAIEACANPAELSFVGQRIKEVATAGALREPHLKQLDRAWRTRNAALAEKTGVAA